MQFSGRLLKWTAAIAAIFAVAGVVAYGELVQDWRVPRSTQTIRSASTVVRSFLMADFNQLTADMEKKYGARVSTVFQLDARYAEVKLDGKLVETHPELVRLGYVYGMFVVGPEGGDLARFPFKLDPDQPIDLQNRSLMTELREHFKKAPQNWLAFGDGDWTTDRCASLPEGLGLGTLGGLLQLQRGSSCVVSWKGSRPASMLVIVGRGNGDGWMRPFAPRLCRNVTMAELERRKTEGEAVPDYAACILSHQRVYTSGRASVAAMAFTVNDGSHLERATDF
ncbi:hypothetical protein JQ596_34030 [Bradyrhizobium manausense]|uniref:hypothetical protein n=1 Tax=Bradyrhizobium TaxID=374 RepID=UPI001BA970E4|nr:MULTISPECIES: hypothetical protein [Bradyrhizobium]MBR0830538.1 hypothetical protein [Bradyrhizobium manausense]UVO28233.1 hypothetical protein KUF59_38160 [Bradyrhizobium arachidis]